MTLQNARIAIWGDGGRETEFISQQLSGLGATVEDLRSLEEACAAVRAGRVDLVVGWLDGQFLEPFELLAWLQSQTAGPPVVIVTPSGDVDLYLEAMRRGAFDCIGLPLYPQELARIVACALEASRARTVLGGG